MKKGGSMMATGNNSNRSSGQAQIPERVQQAAQGVSQNTASGLYRGFIPQNTGGYSPAGVHQQRTGSIPQWNQSTGNHMRQDAAQAPGMDAGYRENAGYTSSVMGAQRGFVAAPVQQAPKQGKATGGKIRILIAVAAFMVLAGLAVYGLAVYLPEKQRVDMIHQQVTAYDHLFCPGVYVDGISLGGMTTEQAWNSVTSQIQQRSDAWQVTLSYGGNVVASINASNLEMGTDPSETLNQAWQQGHSGTEQQRYDAMLALQQQPYQAYTAHPSGDNSRIDQLMNQLKAMIDTPAEDAVLVGFVPDLEEPFVFKEEVYGKSLNTAPLVEKLYQMVSTMESGNVEIVPELIEPAVKKVDIEKHYMRRASVTTPIDRHSTENRNNNIRRAFEFINGYTLAPGRTFSFNNVVGERTIGNGFYEAIEYAYGEHVMGVGGGVCQASTTVYQAAVCAGLQILNRKPHSDSVSYTDYGKDATVSWVGNRKVDLTFKNNTDGNIYFVAHVEQDPSNKNRLVARVTIYGEYMGDVRYELTSEIAETLLAPFEPKYIKDTNAEYVTYTDQQKSVSKAKEGYIVNSYRVRYDANVQTEKKLLFTDQYDPKPEKIYVGVTQR